MKLKEYSDCTLPQRSLIDKISEAERRGVRFYTQDGNEMRSAHALEAKGHVEIHTVAGSHTMHRITLS